MTKYEKQISDLNLPDSEKNILNLQVIVTNLCNNIKLKIKLIEDLAKIS